MKIDINIWIIIVLFISVLLMLVIFGSIIKFISSKIEKDSRRKPVHYAIGTIDIQNKKVMIESISDVRKGDVDIYNIDDFIYMLSINPDSKPFRELLKLINNKSTKKKIAEKISSIPNTFITLIDFSPKRRTLSLININSNHEDDGYIQFQIQNNEINPKKTHIDMDFFEESIDPKTDSEIFSALLRTSKNFLSKGATIIKLSPKYTFIESGKDYLLNTIQLTALRRTLAKDNINTHLGRDGSLYAIVANDRKKQMVSVQKNWETKISSLFQKIKFKEFIELNIDEINIDTFILTSKDSKSINEGLLFVNLITDYKRNNWEYDIEDVIYEAIEINKAGEDLVKKLKDKKPPIRVVENKIEERGFKSIHEVYIDYPRETLDLIMKLSFKHKKDIMESLLKFGNKEATKLKDAITTISMDMTLLPEIHKALNNETIRKNLYITLPERERAKHFHKQLVESSRILKEKNIKTIQFIHEYIGGSVEIYRIFKSELVLLMKSLNDTVIISDRLKINLKNIENIKDKETKIINIK